MANPWERRKAETKRAHAALLDYCALGPGRSIRTLWAHYRQLADVKSATGAATRKPPSRRLRTLAQWSSSNDWPERAAAWDAHMRTKEEDKWAAFLDELREKERRISDRLLEKAEQMLKYPLAQVVKREGKDEQGRTLLTIVEPASWRMPDATRMAAEGSKLGRKAAGVEEEHGKAVIALGDGVQVNIEFKSDLERAYGDSEGAEETPSE